MTRTSHFALAALLGLAACTVNPDKIKPTAGDLCREATSVMVDRLAECTSAPLAVAQQYAPLLFGLDCGKWDTSVAEGHLAYDSSYAVQCIGDLHTATCVELFYQNGGGPPGACALAIKGLVPAGSACASSEECVGGTYCTYTSACGGTCKAYANLGQYCWDGTTSTQCAAGLLCMSDPSPATTSTCRAPLQAGQLCPTGWGCADGLYCDRSSGVSTSYSCKVQQTTGSCGQYDVCLTPLYVCSGASISYATPGTCRPVGRQGQSCKNGYNDCVWGTYCNTGSTPPAVGVAGTCIIFPGPPAVCGPYGSEYVSCLDSYCKIPTGLTNGNCTPYIPLGNACVSGGAYDQCGFGNYTCNASNVCAVRCP